MTRSGTEVGTRDEEHSFEAVATPANQRSQFSEPGGHLAGPYFGYVDSAGTEDGHVQPKIIGIV